MRSCNARLGNPSFSYGIVIVTIRKWLTKLCKIQLTSPATLSVSKGTAVDLKLDYNKILIITKLNYRTLGREVFSSGKLQCITSISLFPNWQPKTLNINIGHKEDDRNKVQNTCSTIFIIHNYDVGMKARPKGHIAIQLYKVAEAHPTTTTKKIVLTTAALLF